MTAFDDAQIIRSWDINAASWIKAIKNREIESRNLVTNEAVISLIIKSHPDNILDLGCGEGWLANELASRGYRVFGIDGIKKLIDQAKISGDAGFDVCSYENLMKYIFKERFDCVVCNFSLIGKESTQAAIQSSSCLLRNKGRLIVQTLHPQIACGDLPYAEGWRLGSWSGFSNDFTEPAPWYFRTIESWITLFNDNNFKNIKMYEPMNPRTCKPASIIFECCVV